LVITDKGRKKPEPSARLREATNDRPNGNTKTSLFGLPKRLAKTTLEQYLDFYWSVKTPP
jgi:hypothetical protein